MPAARAVNCSRQADAARHVGTHDAHSELAQHPGTLRLPHLHESPPRRPATPRGCARAPATSCLPEAQAGAPQRARGPHTPSVNVNAARAPFCTTQPAAAKPAAGRDFVLLLDASRSMRHTWDEVVCGVNSFLNMLRASAPPSSTLRLALFNDELTDVYRGDAASCPNLQLSAAVCSGHALPLEALASALRVAPRGSKRPKMLLIFSGGVDEAELHYSADQTAQLVAAQMQRDSSEVIYLGTRHDALSCASRLAVPRRTTLRVSPSLPRAALQAAAAAVQAAVLHGTRVTFTPDHRLFSDPCIAR